MENDIIGNIIRADWAEIHNSWEQVYEFHPPAAGDVLKECTASIVKRTSFTDWGPEYDMYLFTAYDVPEDASPSHPNQEDWWEIYVERMLHDAKEWAKLHLPRFAIDYPAEPEIGRHHYLEGLGRREFRLQLRPHGWESFNHPRQRTWHAPRQFWNTQYSLTVRARCITYYTERERNHNPPMDLAPLTVNIWIHRRASYVHLAWELFTTWLLNPWYRWIGRPMPFPCNPRLKYHVFMPPNPFGCVVPRMNTLFKNPLSADHDM